MRAVGQVLIGRFEEMIAIVLAAAWGLTSASTLVKVRPDKPLPKDAVAVETIGLDAARGECESTQLVFSAKENLLEKLSVEADFVRFKDAKIPVEVFREAFVTVSTPSNTEGSVGQWPDPLIPAVDAHTGEKRNAFPIDVPKGRHQPVLVEVCVPVDAKPGQYTGTLQVKAKGVKRSVPMSVRVRNIVVPATATFPTTFGLSGRSLEFGHYGKKLGDEKRLELVHAYAKEALRHRLSLHTMSMIAPKVSRTKDGAIEVDFSAWDAEIGPYLQGKALPSGARYTSIDLRVPYDLPASDRAAYLKEVERHFKEKGWLDRLFSYVMDEPKPSDRPELVTRLQSLQPAKGIRRLVTTAYDPQLSPLIDIWVPNVNCVFIRGKDGELCSKHPARSSYEVCEKNGAKVWWYQSCSSHGCHSGPFGKPALDAYFAGWPSYMVDAPGTSARAMAWLAFVHDIQGELYFDMAHAFNAYPKKDPWDDVWAFGGNGDGTLFYPGRPDRIGGTTHAPVTSLRMRHIRDGLEDLELLRLLAKRPGGQKKAMALARSLVPEPWRIEHDANKWKTARQQLLDALTD